MDDEIRSAVKDATLEALEVSLSVQLKAVRALRRQSPQQDRAVSKAKAAPEGRSQVEMALAILQASPEPLHVSNIIEGIKKRFKVAVDRESLVSAMTKKVAREQMFVRVAPNTFKAR